MATPACKEVALFGDGPQGNNRGVGKIPRTRRATIDPTTGNRATRLVFIGHRERKTLQGKMGRYLFGGIHGQGTGCPGAGTAPMDKLITRSRLRAKFNRGVRGIGLVTIKATIDPKDVGLDQAGTRAQFIHVEIKGRTGASDFQTGPGI